MALFDKHWAPEIGETCVLLPDSWEVTFRSLNILEYLGQGKVINIQGDSPVFEIGGIVLDGTSCFHVNQEE